MLGNLEMCFEVVPGACSSGTRIPDFAVLKVKAGFKNQCVGNAEEQFGGVWLAAIGGVVLAIFDLFDEAIERTVGVPSSTHFGIVVFELKRGDVAVVVEQVCQAGADGLVHVSDVTVFQCANIDVVKGRKELFFERGVDIFEFAPLAQIFCVAAGDGAGGGGIGAGRYIGMLSGVDGFDELVGSDGCVGGG